MGTRSVAWGLFPVDIRAERSVNCTNNVQPLKGLESGKGTVLRHSRLPSIRYPRGDNACMRHAGCSDMISEPVDSSESLATS